MFQPMPYHKRKFQYKLLVLLNSTLPDNLLDMLITELTDNHNLSLLERLNERELEKIW